MGSSTGEDRGVHQGGALRLPRNLPESACRHPLTPRGGSSLSPRPLQTQLTLLAQLQIRDLTLINNSLTGPAFPSRWLAPAAMPLLGWLDVSGNAQLTGTLPSNLAWPKLAQL